ncbi:MAG: HAD hydrolase-like protein [Eubacteriales bacterium]|nr:HAD hydrolase-like protein [Eubacteriales bacterium]
MAVRQILWDWNGTLLNDLEYAMGVRNRTFPAFGLPTIDSVESYHAQFTFPVRTYYERAGVTDSLFDAVAHAWMAEYVRGEATIPLHEDALETIARFREAGLHQVVLSASHLDVLQEQLAIYGLEKSFDAVLGLSDIYAGSKEEIGRAYLSQCGVSPSDTVMLGDTLHDAEVAQAIGASCVLIARGHQSAQTLREAGVPVVNNLGEAAKLLLN